MTVIISSIDLGDGVWSGGKSFANHKSTFYCQWQTLKTMHGCPEWTTLSAEILRAIWIISSRQDCLALLQPQLSYMVLAWHIPIQANTSIQDQPPSCATAWANHQRRLPPWTVGARTVKKVWSGLVRRWYACKRCNVIFQGKKGFGTWCASSKTNPQTRRPPTMRQQVRLDGWEPISSRRNTHKPLLVQTQL